MIDWLGQAWDDICRNTVLFPVELAVVIFCLLFQQIPGLSIRVPALCNNWLRFLLRRRRLAVAFVFVFTLGGRFLAEPGYTIPAPGIHDEFSYLLAADTFASGRVTNPPHAMSYFFESFHILTHPTYMSMYPPGQGLMLALGIKIGGHPIVGVWLSAALSCAALCWMLQGWTKPGWALTGGMIAAVRIGWFSYWANSYWGGCVSALGGALIFGAAPRLLHRPAWKHAAAFGAGLLILVNTRMWEGSIVALAVTIWLIVAIARRHGWKRFTPILVPIALILVPGAAGMAYYNWRVTGNPLRPPYLENRNQYETYGSFFWNTPRTGRLYNHPMLRKFYVEWENYPAQSGYLPLQIEKPRRIWVFFFGPALTVSLFGLWRSWRSRRLLLPWIVLGAFTAAHLLVQWQLIPHYAGPITAVLYLLMVEGFRGLSIWRRRRQGAGIHWVRAAVAAVAVMALFRSVAPSLGVNVYREYTLPWYSYGLHANFHRLKIEERLTGMQGKHLVLVSYGPEHNTAQEWVYNRADIDGAPVVWARHVADPSRLIALLQYFRERRVWIIYPDSNPGQLTDYRGGL